MPPTNPILSSFVIGELSKLLRGRTDLENYYAGSRQMENFIPLPQGPTFFRPGTKYVAGVKTNSKKVRMIPFEYSSVQAYVLELGDIYIRFYKDRAQILFETLEIDSAPAPGDFIVGGTITGATSTETCKVVSKTDATHYVIQSRTGAFTDGEVLSDGTNSRDCAPGHPVVANGAAAEIVSPWLEAELPDIQFVQSADEMFLVHQSHPVQKLTRQSHNEWTLLAKSTAGGSPFTAGVGEEDFDNVDGLHNPSVVTFHEERLILGGILDSPFRFWGSIVDSWEDFTQGTSADDAFEYRLVSDKVDAVKWAVSKNVLLFGTQGGEWKGSDLAPNADFPNIKRQSSYGSKLLQAVLLSDSLLYVQRQGKKVQEMRFDFDADSWSSREMTLLADHITGTGIVDRDYQQEPYPLFWCVRADGKMAVMTYNKDQGVIGWCRIETDGLFESVAIISGSGEDEIWVSVKRTIGGSTVRYIEYFTPFDWGTDQEDAVRVDSALTFDGGAAVTITGATAADPVVITAAAHGFENDEFVRILRVGGMTEINDTIYLIKNKATNTFELHQQDGLDGIDGSAFTAFVGTVTGDTTKGNVIIDGMSAADVTAIATGCGISGTGIPTGATVVSKGTTDITISAGATATGSATSLTISGNAQIVAKTLTGLTHLEAEHVSISADGGAHAEEIVASGAITLDRWANTAHVGMGYIGEVETMDLEAGAEKGTAQGQTRAISKVTIRMHNSLGGSIGPDAANQEKIIHRGGDDVMGVAPPLTTGDEPATWRGGFSKEAVMLLRQTQPLPFTLVALIPEMVTND